jgi:hypothetical protein
MALLALRDIFGDLADHQDVVKEITSALHAVHRGPRSMRMEWAGI